MLPTQENVERLCEDLRSNMYQSYYVNFITHVPRELLEYLAETIYDQYVNFICLESDLFVLSNPNQNILSQMSYYNINRSNITSEHEIEAMVNVIVDGLFSVLLTMDSIPFITFSQGGMAEAVGKAIDKRLRASIHDSSNNFFSGSEVGLAMGQLSFNRPLLILVDRDFDMATPLQHAWSYQALIHDLIGSRMNRITIQVGKDKPAFYVLGETNDNFWNNHRSSSFPQVAEDIQHELDSYRVSEQEVKTLRDILGTSETDDVSLMVSDTTCKLNTAVSNLPQLIERKRYLDMHTNIATSLLERIKSRQIDVLFEYEQKLASKQDLGRPMWEILSDKTDGTGRDKLRVFLTYLISSDSSPSMNKSEMSKCEKALLSSGCTESDILAIRYVHRWRCITQRMTVDSGSSITAQTSMFSDLLTKASRFAMDGVRNFSIKRKQRLPLTKLVECLMDQQQTACPGSERFVFVDPKRISNVERSRLKNNAFTSSIVFVIGGGCYLEYSNLLECLSVGGSSTTTTKMTAAAATTSRNITYGCTELLSPEIFLDQLCKLGEDVK
ncbi:hypothetical protein ACOME3_001418 [Neoechinorhynchus agilis]